MGRPVWRAAGTFGRRCAFVAGSAAGVDAVDVAASAVHRPPAACAEAGAGPG